MSRSWEIMKFVSVSIFLTHPVYKFSEYFHILPASLSLKILDFSPELKKTRDVGLWEMKKGIFSENFCTQSCKIGEKLQNQEKFWKFQLYFERKIHFHFSDIALASQSKKSLVSMISAQKLP